MRIKTIRISGFKPIPFKATYQESPGRGKPAELHWESDAFHLSLAHQGPPFLNAIIGPNSSGKSSIFYALNAFFANKTRLPENWYNQKDTSRPVIVEITFTGTASGLDKTWVDESCTDNGDNTYDLTIAYVWPWETTRLIIIQKADGRYYKTTSKDKEGVKQLLPIFRMLPADKKLSDDANPERNDLISDLIQFTLEGGRAKSNRSIIYKFRRIIEQMKTLADRSRSPNTTAWREIEELEQLLSESVGSITPGNPNVRIQLDAAIPELSQIFHKSKIVIDDGVELDFSEHGMGLQRSFAVSALHAWNKVIASQSSQDYVFAIEEPELYLHPHATRVFLKTLEEIAKKNQVIFTTHSSEFVNRVPLENVISIRRTGNERKIITPNLTGLSQREKTQVRRYLREHRSDMLFARAVLLVEGASERYAIPAFATKLDSDFDRSGVTVVFVDGKNNFRVYHQILDAFDIPHAILGDGDGDAASRRIEYRYLGISDIFILENDFEREVANAIVETDPRRCLQILNRCLSLRGESTVSEHTLFGPSILKQEKVEKCASKLKSRKIGKPLAGKIIGESLTVDEIRMMPAIVNAIEAVVRLAQSR